MRRSNEHVDSFPRLEIQSRLSIVARFALDAEGEKRTAKPRDDCSRRNDGRKKCDRLDSHELPAA